MGRQAQRPLVQAPEQHCVAVVHIASVGRHASITTAQRPAWQVRGGQQLDVPASPPQALPAVRHIGTGVQRPLVQALGAQQSRSWVQVSPVGRQGGVHRRSMQLCGAQHPLSLPQLEPSPGHAFHTRNEVTTSSPRFGRYCAP